MRDIPGALPRGLPDGYFEDPLKGPNDLAPVARRSVLILVPDWQTLERLARDDADKAAPEFCAALVLADLLVMFVVRLGRPAVN